MIHMNGHPSRGATLTGPATNGFKTVLHPASDLTKANLGLIQDRA